jgi:hypothetical protein
MKRTESTASTQVLKKTQPEEFDLVILRDGTGSDGTFPILAPKVRKRSVCHRIVLVGKGKGSSAVSGPND